MIIKDDNTWECPHCGAVRKESIHPLEIYAMRMGLRQKPGCGCHQKEFICLKCKKNFGISVSMNEPTFTYTTFIYEDWDDQNQTLNPSLS